MVRESQEDQRVAAHLTIRGRVQGVGYRFFAQEQAHLFNLTGWVRNCPDRDVEAVAEGSRVVIEAFVEKLKEGPVMARVDSVTVDWLSTEEHYSSFSILS